MPHNEKDENQAVRAINNFFPRDEARYCLKLKRIIEKCGGHWMRTKKCTLEEDLIEAKRRLASTL